MNSESRMKFLMIFGWLSGCVPCGYRVLSSPSSVSSSGPDDSTVKDSLELKRSEGGKKFNHGKILDILNVMISAGLWILYAFINLNIICLNNMSVIAESDQLSVQIVVSTILFPKAGADVIIRAFCCIFYKRILKLVQNVLELHESVLDFPRRSEQKQKSEVSTNANISVGEGKRISNGPLSCLGETSRERSLQFDYARKNKCLTLMSLFTILLCAAGDLMVSVDYNWRGTQYSKHLTMYFVPTSELGLRIYFQLTDILPVLSLAFALAFVVVFAWHLVGLHGIILDKLSRLILLRKKEEEFIKCLTFYHDEMGEAKKMLARDFIRLKECFEEFGKIAGIFIIALMYTAVLSIIGGISSVTILQKDVNLLDTLGDIATVLLLARLGNFIHATIDKHREDCRNETSFGQIMVSKSSQQPSDPFLDWVLNWRWKLTACQVFNVDHDLVPAVVATLMTYFIFMFQLKTSENTK